MSEKIYEMITNRMIELLEKGVVPWRVGAAVNWKNQKPYRGINTLLLEPGEYASFKQVTEAGGTVKKGEKGHIVVFWTWLEKEDDDSDKPVKIPFLRYYNLCRLQGRAACFIRFRPGLLPTGTGCCQRAAAMRLR